MNKRRISLLAIVFVLAFTASGCGYNALTTRQQNVKGKWANVEAQLQRRSDLIPNLFEAAKAAGFQEQQVFGEIAAARSRLLNATGALPQGENGDKSPEQKQAVIDANNSFGGTIGRLLSVVENYPTLKSSESFQKFQDSLEGTENRIATARKDYNDAVQDYNTTRAKFPTVISAKLFGFKEEPFFKADETAKQVPRINANEVRPNQNGAEKK
jgi:LemA protein